MIDAACMIDPLEPIVLECYYVVHNAVRNS